MLLNKIIKITQAYLVLFDNGGGNRERDFSSCLSYHKLVHAMLQCVICMFRLFIVNKIILCLFYLQHFLIVRLMVVYEGII